MAREAKKTTTAPKGVSLHIGLNFVDPDHYQGWDGALAACEFDAEDMKRLAEDRDFKSTSLIRGAATRRNVLDALNAAATSLVGGDFFLVSYSGHGGQLPDYSGDEKDNKDETWCLFDGQLIDDELYEIWSKFASGVRILILSDSCHSGTIYRTAAATGERVRVEAGQLSDTILKPRAMPEDVAARTFRAHSDDYLKIQKSQLKRGWKGSVREGDIKLKCTLATISGCTDSQYSYDGVGNGQFTAQLLRTWDNGRFKGDYNLFHRSIRKGLPDNQTPVLTVLGAASASFERETPFAI